MPFDRRVEKEDPEAAAEREFESLSSGSGGSGRHSKSAKESSPSTPGAVSRSSTEVAVVPPVISPSNVNGTSSEDAASVRSGKVVLAKVAKAERKKRTRGVSGSAIKKDGGRFKLGFENMDNYDDKSDGEESDFEDYENYVKDNYGSGKLACESDNSSGSADAAYVEDAERVREVLQEVLRGGKVSDKSASRLVALLSGHFDEHRRLVCLERAIDDLVETDEWTGEEQDQPDRMAEYRVVCILARLLDDGIIGRAAFHAFIAEIGTEAQTIRFFLAAEKFVEERAPELKGNILREPPSELAELSREVALSGCGSHLKDALIACPFFHAHIVHQVCVESLMSMNMDIIFYAVKALKELLHNKELTVAVVNAGVSRMLDELRDLEKDLPAANSLAFLLVGYAIDSPACIDYSIYAKCPKPKTFLRKRVNSCGRLSIVESSDGECDEKNFIAIDE